MKNQIIKETKKKAKKNVNKKLKKQKGKVMKFMIKLIAKLIWKVTLFAGTVTAVAFLVNKFAPELLDAAVDWLKEQRDDD